LEIDSISKPFSAAESRNHPNIATIHGFDESDGVRFIAMELVEGDSLAVESISN
jgi:serine/threonine protein kinase